MRLLSSRLAPRLTIAAAALLMHLASTSAMAQGSVVTPTPTTPDVTSPTSGGTGGQCAPRTEASSLNTAKSILSRTATPLSGNLPSMTALYQSCGFNYNDALEQSTDASNCSVQLGSLGNDAKDKFGVVTIEQIEALFAQKAGEVNSSAVAAQLIALAQAAAGAGVGDAAGAGSAAASTLTLEQLLQQTRDMAVVDVSKVQPLPNLQQAYENAVANELAQSYLPPSCETSATPQQKAQIETQRENLAREASFDSKTFARALENNNTLGKTSAGMSTLIDARMAASKNMREDIQVLTEAVTNLYYLMELNIRTNIKMAEMQARMFDKDDAIMSQGPSFAQSIGARNTTVAALQDPAQCDPAARAQLVQHIQPSPQVPQASGQSSAPAATPYRSPWLTPIKF